MEQGLRYLKKLPKGCEFMRKIIAIVSALVLVGCIAVVFCGCGADDEQIMTSVPTTTDEPDTQRITSETNEGMVTDNNDDRDNGVIGDIVTDVSEGVSDMVTDVSEGVSRILE